MAQQPAPEVRVLQIDCVTNDSIANRRSDREATKAQTHGTDTTIEAAFEPVVTRKVRQFVDNMHLISFFDRSFGATIVSILLI